MRPRRPSPALVVALAALFVALGGPAEAKRQASKLIPGSSIKASSITTKQIKNRTLGESDLSSPLVRKLLAVPANGVSGGSVADGSLSGADLGVGSVGGDRLVAGSVTSATVADESLSAADLAAGSVGGSELADDGVGVADLAPGAVTGPAIRNGSLTGADVGRFVGTIAALPFGSIAAGTCSSQTSGSLTAPGASDTIDDDAIVITPSAAFPALNLSLYAQPVGTNQIKVTICNPSTTAAVAVNNQSFRFVTFDLPG